MVIPIFLLTLLLLLFVSFISAKKQLLPALLLLEALVLNALLLSLFFLSKSESSLFIFILLLTLGVCEAGLALSLLLSYIKVSGSDYINSNS
uniref:NADH dehydrogenase subunit 4L n=1 Tax=Megalophaedusa hakonensis TaxID=1885699 RepID=A0A224AAI0_9EUPU|nr:NADH dehydrogenase subunit 4L [Megalophaedusa hakonensis]